MPADVANQGRVLVVDAGNVLLYFERKQVAKNFKIAFNLKASVDEIDALLNGGDIGPGLLQRFETGAIKPTRYLQAIAELLTIPGTIDPEAFWTAHTDMLEVNTPLVEIVRRFMESHPDWQLGLLSDVDERRLVHPKGIAKAGLKFDHVVASCHVGARKPTPVMYHTMQDYTRHHPSHHFFVDDKPENVEGAIRYGWAAHWYDLSDPQRDTVFEKILSTFAL